MHTNFPTFHSDVHEQPQPYAFIHEQQMHYLSFIHSWATNTLPFIQIFTRSRCPTFYSDVHEKSLPLIPQSLFRYSWATTAPPFNPIPIQNHCPTFHTLMSNKCTICPILLFHYRPLYNFAHIFFSYVQAMSDYFFGVGEKSPLYLSITSLLCNFCRTFSDVNNNLSILQNTLPYLQLKMRLRYVLKILRFVHVPI